MYTVKDYMTKKALIDDVRAGLRVGVYQPGGIFPNQRDGTVYLEGPHYPKPHRWYAKATIVDGIITKVK